MFEANIWFWLFLLSASSSDQRRADEAKRMADETKRMADAVERLSPEWRLAEEAKRLEAMRLAEEWRLDLAEGRRLAEKDEWRAYERKRKAEDAMRRAEDDMRREDEVKRTPDKVQRTPDEVKDISPEWRLLLAAEEAQRRADAAKRK